jgi:hypothetical protein
MPMSAGRKVGRLGIKEGGSIKTSEAVRTIWATPHGT